MTATLTDPDARPNAGMGAFAHTSTARPRTARLLRVLPAVTLAAVLTITASAEYELARTVLDLSPRVAWALPVAVDSYVLAALRSRRDVPAALAVMAGALTASMAAHLAAARSTPGTRILPTEIVAPAATVIMVVLVVVAWRVHVLLDHPHPPVTGADAPTDTAAPANTPAAASAPAPVPTDTPPWPVPGRAAAGGPVPSTPPGATDRSHPRAPGTPDVTGQPDTPGTRPSNRVAVVQQSDDEILATLDGTSPGVRALMRTHGIGRARAARLHRQTLTQTITTNGTKTEPEEREPRPENDQKNQQQNRIEIHYDNSEDDHKNEYQQPKDEDPEDPEKESDTGITDRVGPSRSLDLEGKSPLADLPGAFARVGEA